MSKNVCHHQSDTSLDKIPMHSKTMPTEPKTFNSQEPTLSNPPRRHFTRQRRQLSDGERRQLAQSASLHLTKLQQRLPTHARIGLYYDGFGELPTQLILDWCQRLGYLPYLPVVGSLSRTSNGNDNKRLRFVPVYHSKLVNVPTRTHQLGMKQNHRSGAKKPLKIGWCYDFQVVEQLARQPWDVPLDGLITPSSIRWF